MTNERFEEIMRQVYHASADELRAEFGRLRRIEAAATKVVDKFHSVGLGWCIHEYLANLAEAMRKDGER